MSIDTAHIIARAKPAVRSRPPAAILGDTMLGYRQWLQAEIDSVWQSRRITAAPSRHALVVATSLPPRFDGGVFRPLSWLQYAEENGWRISAVTRASSGDENDAGRQLAASIPSHVSLCYAPVQHLRPSWRLFMQVDGGLLTALAMFRAAASSFGSRPPSVVLATGPKFAAFIAGFFLARRFRARLMLDYRDEWSENPFEFVEKGRDNRWWERRCLKAADAVLFTTKSQLSHARAVFPEDIGAKGGVLLNGWEPDPYVAAAELECCTSNRMIIATSGVLGSMVPPGPFLRDLTQVIAAVPRHRASLRLRFIGRRLSPATEELSRFPHQDLLELVDQCPRPEADRLIRRSNVLLLLTNTRLARYLPGKLFEYLATGKPILVVGHPGEAQDLVVRLGAGLYVADGDTDALARALDTLSRTPSAVWNTRRRQEWAREHTRRQMARILFDRMSALIDADNTGVDLP